LMSAFFLSSLCGSIFFPTEHNDETKKEKVIGFLFHCSLFLVKLLVLVTRPHRSQLCGAFLLLQ